MATQHGIYSCDVLPCAPPNDVGNKCFMHAVGCGEISYSVYLLQALVLLALATSYPDLRNVGWDCTNDPWIGA